MSDNKINRYADFISKQKENEDYGYPTKVEEGTGMMGKRYDAKYGKNAPGGDTSLRATAERWKKYKKWAAQDDAAAAAKKKAKTEEE